MPTNTNREETTDVVVIGYGFAGAAAAITAHDAGARVTILEKMPHPGGNSRVSGGNCLVPRPTEEAANGFSEYMKAITLNTTPAPVIDRFVRDAQTLKEWFTTLGGTLTIPEKNIISTTYPRMIRGPGFPKIASGHGTFDKHTLQGDPKVPPSLRMWGLLSSNVEKRGIKVHVNARASELMTDDRGAVVGVVAEIDGARVAVRANKAVIMTCGGFENGPDLKWDYLPPKPLKFLGNPGNTGDGVRMVQRIGGDLWHMTRTACIIGYQSSEYEAAFGIFFQSDGFIYVDKHGRRFASETDIELHEFYSVLSHFDTDHVEFPRIPCWGIFNEETRRAGPLTWDVSGYNRDLYKWSADNSKEIEKGSIVKADTLKELAARMGQSEEVLTRTLDTYNRSCASGVDDALGRSKETLKPLTPPYYAIQMYPAVLNTQGGARRDEQARILDVAGKPIPRLYAAGEFGSIWGYLYQGATNVAECMVFGRIAGTNAAGEVSL